MMKYLTTFIIFAFGAYGVSCSSEYCRDQFHYLSKLKPESVYSDKGQAALVKYIERGNVSKILKLIEGGVDINGCGQDGLRPIFWAFLQKDTNTFRVLLERGADPNVLAHFPMTIWSWKGTFSPMHLAAAIDNSEFLRLALKYKGNPNLLDEAGKYTVLDLAIHNKQLSNVRLLVEAGANISHRDFSGKTPLMEAAVQGQYDIVLYLLQVGADPSVGYYRKPEAGLGYFIKINQGRQIDMNSEQGKAYQMVCEELKKRGLLE